MGGQFYIPHPLGDLLCECSSPFRNQDKLCPRTGSVSDLSEPARWKGREHPDANRAVRVDAVSKATGDDHLIDFKLADTCVVEQNLDTSTDSGFYQLDLPDVALSDYDVLTCPGCFAERQNELGAGSDGGRSITVQPLTPAMGIALPDPIPMKNPHVALLALLLPAFVAACAQPPREAIEAAQAAIDAASREPDVALYAPDALRAAEEQLAALLAESTAQERRPAPVRNYDRTAALASAAREAGEAARAEAAAAKELAAVEAAALIESAGASLAAIEIKAGQARRMRGIKLDMNTVIASIVEARAMLETARSDLTSLAYASSRAKAAAAGARISALDEVISEAMLIARRK
jgi:hypothetical protein